MKPRAGRAADFAGSPISLPPRHMWRWGRCVCCDRQTVVAPGPQIHTDEGREVTLPYCLVGFERAARYTRRAQLRAALYDLGRALA
ncbi:hypothetical protein ABH930_003350 [Kitasatospora sp. GAS204A]|nr:hypothetical protein [Kitasatospora sp. GAS204B]